MLLEAVLRILARALSELRVRIVTVKSALIVLSIVPLAMGIYHISFEHKRWSESMFSSSGDDSDDDE